MKRYLTRPYFALLMMSPIFMLQQIAPAVAAGLIVAGSAILQGLMGAKAQEEDTKRKMILEGNRQRFEGANQSAQNLGNNQQRAFESLMNSYRNTLG